MKAMSGNEPPLAAFTAVVSSDLKIGTQSSASTKPQLYPVLMRTRAARSFCAALLKRSVLPPMVPLLSTMPTAPPAEDHAPSSEPSPRSTKGTSMLNCASIEPEKP